MSDVLAPLEFRFTDPADVATYGDRWWRYDEPAIVRTSARRLLELEVELGYPIARVMDEFRNRSVLGLLGAMWLAISMTPREWQLDGFDDFTPLVFATQWREAVEDEAGKDDAPSPEASGTAPAVVIASLPAAG